VHVSLAPTLNVLIGQLISAVLDSLGFFPAPTLRQNALPLGEYSPSPTQAAQLLLPPRLALPASQSMHALVVSATALLPAPHSSQEDWPAID